MKYVLREDIRSIDLEVATIEAGTVFDSAFMNAGPMSSPFMKEGVPEKVTGTTALGLWVKKGPLHHLEMAFLPNIVLEGVLGARVCSCRLSDPLATTAQI